MMQPSVRLTPVEAAPIAAPVAQAAARAIAFYLPQFHPIPENDRWWGAGFTEWTNVAKARPLFAGHRQPQLPADLGFYDLRVPETRARQAELARAAGIEAFCYWHYWFGHGRRVIERPFEEVLASGEPDFPFCLAWANQSWTGIWHGNPGTTLISQDYPGAEDEAAHFRWAARAFRDPRYATVDGKPIFVVFAPHDLPSAEGFVAHWRRLAEREGLPGLYLVAISNMPYANVDRYYAEWLAPFDAVTLLTPHDYLETWNQATRGTLRRRVRELNLGRAVNRFKPARWRRPTRIDYADVVRHAFEDMPDDPRFLPSVLPNWDNTPRSGVRGVVYEGATPEQFKRYLEKAMATLRGRPPETSILFLKAWNEWAEGNFLEPDADRGHERLDVLREVLAPSRPSRPAR